MNFPYVAAIMALLSGSSLSLASSLVYSQGTSSTCTDACSDARSDSLNQTQNLCVGGTAIEKSSQSKCVDGGDYDVRCLLTLEIQCSPSSDAMNGLIGQRGF